MVKLSSYKGCLEGQNLFSEPHNGTRSIPGQSIMTCMILRIALHTEQAKKQRGHSVSLHKLKGTAVSLFAAEVFTNKRMFYQLFKFLQVPTSDKDDVSSCAIPSLLLLQRETIANNIITRFMLSGLNAIKNWQQGTLATSYIYILLHLP